MVASGHLSILSKQSDNFLHVSCTYPYLLERVLAEASAAPGPVALAERIEAQALAWHALAGRWDADQELVEDIDALYAARTPGRPVDL